MAVPESVRDLEEEQRTAKKSWVGVMLGLWLSGVFAGSLFGKLDAETNRSIGMAMLAAAIMWPLAYFAMSRCSFVPRAPKLGLLLALTVFLMWCGLSSVGSPIGLESTGYTVLTFISCWIVLQFNANLGDQQFEKGLRIYTIVMVVLLVWFAFYDYVPGERLGNGRRILNPNTVGLVAMSVFMATFSIKSLFARGMILSAVGFVIILTGSRTALIGSVMAMLIILWVRGRTARMKTISLGLLIIGVVSLVAFIYNEAFLKGLEQVLSLHDRDRGVDSGATGRYEAWEATWNLFLSHPILGVGFRAHEKFQAVASSSHNGYLALLAEIGIIGFVAALYVAIAGLLRIWKEMKDPAHLNIGSVLFGFGCAYLFLAVFERYFINVGNPSSLFFLLCILKPQGLSAGKVELVGTGRAVSTFGTPRRTSSSTDRTEGAYRAGPKPAKGCL